MPDENKPAQGEPKKANERAKDGKPPVVDTPGPTGPDLRSPADWAAATGRVRKPGADVVVNGVMLEPNPFRGEHRAAAIKHEWAGAPSFKLSKDDYEGAIKATKTLKQHAAALPGPRGV
jgi:hypothetical protein